METNPRIAYAVHHLPNAGLAPVPRPRPSRQRVDIVRHQVEEGPQQAVRCDAAERAHAEPAVQAAKAFEHSARMRRIRSCARQFILYGRPTRTANEAHARLAHGAPALARERALLHLRLDAARAVNYCSQS